jgi:electron transfer flavoprotein alpha subunit
MSVLVFAENWDGKFKKSTFELLSYSVKVAGMLNTTATALVLGKVEETALAQLKQYGVRKIIHLVNDQFQVLDNKVYTGMIAEVARREQSSVIVLSNNNTGKALAPRLSVLLKAGLGAGVNTLPLSVDPFVITKKVFSGNAVAKVALKTGIRILTLAQNSFELIPDNTDAPVETLSLEPALPPDTRVRDVQKQSGKILLSDAEIVVSGGRGMKSPDNWGPLQELATLLGAATACSRPVSDEGWRPHDEHTGQTGKIIAPNLYFAIGISGATQHLAGVSSSKYIVAINSDKDAPIFEAAQYGIVGDALKVLPKLVEAVKVVKGK